MTYQDDQQSKLTDIGLLLLRLTFGGLMLVGHGWGKMMKIVNGEWGFADPLGLGMEASLVLAVFAEVICAVLIIIGLFTRFATIPLIITMLVAAFIVHANDGFSKIEFAVLYLVPYIVLLLTGPGRYSIDARR